MWKVLNNWYIIDKYRIEFNRINCKKNIYIYIYIIKIKVLLIFYS